MTLIKICGLSDRAGIEAAIAAGASHIGFVHFEPSPRHLPMDRIVQLGQWAKGKILRVLVLVDPDDATISLADQSGAVDIIQLHGKESPERVRKIRERTDLQLWKAFSIETAEDVAASARFDGLCDLILYDAKTPKGSALPGGMGASFDWSLLAARPLTGPWGLSGGLDPDTVTAAITQTGAPLVDVSSGVESQSGVKDMDKVARFCQAVRHHDKA